MLTLPKNGNAVPDCGNGQRFLCAINELAFPINGNAFPLLGNAIPKRAAATVGTHTQTVSKVRTRPRLAAHPRLPVRASLRKGGGRGKKYSSNLSIGPRQIFLFLWCGRVAGCLDDQSHSGTNA